MVDALCWDDVDLFGAELDDPLEELLQDLYHRLLEAPGSNIDDKARGYGLQGKLSGGVPASKVADLISNGIEAEFRKDERVTGVAVSVTSPSTGVYQLDIQIVANESLLGIKLVSDGAGVRRIA